MRDVEQLLRDELSRRSRLPAPQTADVLRGVRRRRRRGVVAAVAACMLAVIAATVGAALGLRPAVGPVLPLAPPAPTGPVTLNGPGEIRFADADHGYALATSCPTASCDTVLLATDDGGRTWRRQVVPGLSFPKDQGFARVSMRVLDADRVAIEDSEGERRWFTADGGRTWSHPSPQPQGTVAEIPLGALAEQRPHPDALQPAQIVVLLPDGTSSLLATPPAAPHPTMVNSEVTLADDGSAWVFGGDDTRAWLWVSRDGGRTWREVPLPGGAGRETGGRGPLVDNGRDVYVVEEFPKRRVWRTVDDGAHWTPLAGDLPAPMADVGLASVVSFDGTLLVYDLERGALYSAAPDDDRLRPAGTGPIWQRAGARYVRVSGQDPDTATYQHSTNGQTWTELRL